MRNKWDNDNIYLVFNDFGANICLKTSFAKRKNACICVRRDHSLFDWIFGMIIPKIRKFTVCKGQVNHEIARNKIKIAYKNQMRWDNVINKFVFATPVPF